MTDAEINTLVGKTVILRRNDFLSKTSSYYDIECKALKVLPKSIMCDFKSEILFIPKILCYEKRSNFITPEGKPIIFLPYWFRY